MNIDELFVVVDERGDADMDFVEINPLMDGGLLPVNCCCCCCCI